MISQKTRCTYACNLESNSELLNVILRKHISKQKTVISFSLSLLLFQTLHFSVEHKGDARRSHSAFAFIELGKKLMEVNGDQGC